MRFITLIPDIIIQDREKKGKGDNGLIKIIQSDRYVCILGCDLVWSHSLMEEANMDMKNFQMFNSVLPM